MPRGSAPLIPRGLCAYVFAGANTAVGRRAEFLMLLFLCFELFFTAIDSVSKITECSK